MTAVTDEGPGQGRGAAPRRGPDGSGPVGSGTVGPGPVGSGTELSGPDAGRGNPPATSGPGAPTAGRPAAGTTDSSPAVQRRPPRRPRPTRPPHPSRRTTYGPRSRRTRPATARSARAWTRCANSSASPGPGWRGPISPRRDGSSTRPRPAGGSPPATPSSPSPERAAAANQLSSTPWRAPRSPRPVCAGPPPPRPSPVPGRTVPRGCWTGSRSPDGSGAGRSPAVPRPTRHSRASSWSTCPTTTPRRGGTATRWTGSWRSLTR